MGIEKYINPLTYVDKVKSLIIREKDGESDNSKGETDQKEKYDLVKKLGKASLSLIPVAAGGLAGLLIGDNVADAMDKSRDAGALYGGLAGAGVGGLAYTHAKLLSRIFGVWPRKRAENEFLITKNIFGEISAPIEGPGTPYLVWPFKQIVSEKKEIEVPVEYQDSNGTFQTRTLKKTIKEPISVPKYTQEKTIPNLNIITADNLTVTFNGIEFRHKVPNKKAANTWHYDVNRDENEISNYVASVLTDLISSERGLAELDKEGNPLSKNISGKLEEISLKAQKILNGEDSIYAHKNLRKDLGQEIVSIQLVNPLVAEESAKTFNTNINAIEEAKAKLRLADAEGKGKVIKASYEKEERENFIEGMVMEAPTAYNKLKNAYSALGLDIPDEDLLSEARNISERSHELNLMQEAEGGNLNLIQQSVLNRLRGKD